MYFVVNILFQDSQPSYFLLVESLGLLSLDNFV